ncbi:MAG: hypothetical protein L0Y64_12235 [Myxococcaceae bacterium]|nr:hypothetical protein [Myxococcaceae bacterium]
MRTTALAVLTGMLLLAAPAAEARPYRVMVTRTAETTRAGNLELGLRYQGFFALDAASLPYQQLSPSLRFGVLDTVEVNLHLEVLALGLPNQPFFQVAFGDIPVGVQWTFLETRPFALGVYLRGTVPTGPSTLDLVHPGLSDGTWDAEGTLLAEVRPSRELRFMFNAGYLHHGVRARGDLPDFDVPDAVQASVAGALNLDDLTLIGLELVGRHYFNPQITPAWNDNATQVEIIPVLRREVWPGLVLEAVAGLALTPGLSDIYQFRALIGGTYEFDLATGPNLPERNRPSRPRRR